MAHYNKGGGSTGIISVEHQHELDNMAIYGYNWEAYWDEEKMHGTI